MTSGLALERRTGVFARRGLDGLTGEVTRRLAAARVSRFAELTDDNEEAAT